MSNIIYDYSELRTNGIIPSAVYANGQQVTRLIANGVDKIHKRASYTINFRCGLEFDLTISLENSYRDTGGYWNCGEYIPNDVYEGKYVFVRVAPIQGLKKFLLGFYGDGEMRSLGGIYLFNISVAIYDNYGRRVNAEGSKRNWGYLYDIWEFTTGIVSGFGRVDVAADLKWGDLRWTRDFVGREHSLTASGTFTSSGKFMICEEWQSRSQTKQEY